MHEIVVKVKCSNWLFFPKVPVRENDHISYSKDVFVKKLASCFTSNVFLVSCNC